MYSAELSKLVASGRLHLVRRGRLCHRSGGAGAGNSCRCSSSVAAPPGVARTAAKSCCPSSHLRRRNFRSAAAPLLPQPSAAAASSSAAAASTLLAVADYRDGDDSDDEGDNYDGAGFSHSSAAAKFGDRRQRPSSLFASLPDADHHGGDGRDVFRRRQQEIKQLRGPAFVPSSLDLELGESSIWDRQGNGHYYYDGFDHDDDDDDIDANHGDRHHHHQQQPSSLDSSARDRRQRQPDRSAVELLMHFDPQCPPVSDDPDDLQLWLECEAQQEAVLKYQKVLDGARERGDYSSLSVVQRQVARWVPKLMREISAQQRRYVLKEKRGEEEGKAEAAAAGVGEKASVDGGGNDAGFSVYGPYLCVLPPAKLAVICAHEAIMHALLRSRMQYHSTSENGGVTFLSMAAQIGSAVENEVLIHRVLHRRFREARQMRSALGEGDEEPLELEKNLRELVNGDDASLSGTGEEEGATQPSDGDNSLLDDATHKWSYTSTHLQSYIDEIGKYRPSAKKRRVFAYALRRARKILEKEEPWTSSQKIQLGAALVQVLLQNATVTHPDGKEEMAFTYEKRRLKKNKLMSFVQLNDRLYRMVVSDKLQSLSATTTRHKPMIRPPKPWTSIDKGGYLWIQSELVRYHGCNTQEEALRHADLTTVFDGLNALGRVPWRINRRILDVAQRCWEEDIPLGDIPSQTDFKVPPEPVRPEAPLFGLDKESPEYQQRVEENRRYREALHKYNRIRQRNMDLRSLRCSAMLKLDQAEKFKEFDKIYFPYNMDFRGRAYPVPPHLSNVGSDLCRGMLMFSEGKPLGRRGFYWLKVHLANLAGEDKMSFDDRAAFTEQNIDKVRESAEDPFAGDRWWMGLDDPFQGLAACIEIINAIDSGDPESYNCSLTVHMDGSCNGLQHYAALGRDTVGGKAVNLCAMDGPQDVYSGVMHEVIRRVAEEADRMVDFGGDDFDSLSKEQKKAVVNNRSAKLVNGLIDRGVVKRTVMTSVYGVTYIGARNQIQEKIEEKLENQGVDIDERGHEIFQASGYLAKMTMDVIGDLFTGAKETMNWLSACARLIAARGHPVSWISPIGVPAIQPYRRKKQATIVTLLQTVTVTDDSDDLPIHKQRQVSAFPPNYVHSLDSSHMLLTALEMDRRGLTFSAVHDSFWTHACDIDEMNEALRDVFVDLYTQPLLETLKKTWELRYPDIEFPDLPERGDLDLNEVKAAPYFFQ